jgi:hypothetical protein
LASSGKQWILEWTVNVSGNEGLPRDRLRTNLCSSLEEL